MKKILTLIFAAGIFAICSCGSGSESTEQKTDSTAVMEQAAPAAEQPAAPASDSGAAPADTTRKM